MGETREWDGREEVGFKTRDRVQLAIKKSGDSSIFLRVWLHPACQISDQAVLSPFLFHVLHVEKLRLERRVRRTLCPVCPPASSRGGKRSATSSTPFASLASSCGHLLGDEIINDHAFFF